MLQEAHVGQGGTVDARIRGDDLAGEVRVVHRGVPHTFLAYSTDALEVGTPVLVIANLGPGKVQVEPWDFPAGDTHLFEPVSPD